MSTKRRVETFKLNDLTTWDLEPLGLDLKTLWEAVDYMYATPRVEPYCRALEVLSRIHRTTGEPLLFITGRADPQTAQAAFGSAFLEFYHARNGCVRRKS